MPQVYTEDPDQPGLAHGNLGMYRVQLSGGQYEPDREVGLHYQIHRGIAAHHAAALRRGETLRVNVFVGGPPAMTVAAVMPLPEGMSELALAGVLGRRRVPMICRRGATAHPRRGRFLHQRLYRPRAAASPKGRSAITWATTACAHDFPVMRVEHVYHRPDAIWPFTVVGRPPQEDSIFGQLIHELVGPMMPKQIPGVRAVHAVDAAGVHPLLLAIGSERYVPYEDRPPAAGTAHAGQRPAGPRAAVAGQVSAGSSPPRTIRELDVRDVPEFFRHVLERVDWRRDLHFQTCTTIDTLDYSGGAAERGLEGGDRGGRPAAADAAGGLRQPAGAARGSGIPAAAGVPAGHSGGGRAAVQGRRAGGRTGCVEQFCGATIGDDAINGFPLVVVVRPAAILPPRTLDNFLWTTFTRSNPAADIYGIEPFWPDKHWGCFGSLVIDARSKPHHAPPLVEDPAVTRRVDALAARGRPAARNHLRLELKEDGEQEYE